MTLRGFSIRAANIIGRHVVHKNGHFNRAQLIRWVLTQANKCYGYRYGGTVDNEVRMRLRIQLHPSLPRCPHCNQVLPKRRKV